VLFEALFDATAARLNGAAKRLDIVPASGPERAGLGQRSGSAQTDNKENKNNSHYFILLDISEQRTYLKNTRISTLRTDLRNAETPRASSRRSSVHRSVPHSPAPGQQSQQSKSVDKVRLNLEKFV
jgi:hypothetical protein